MTTLVHESQRWGIGTCVFAVLVSLTVFQITSFNNGVLAEAYPGDLSYLNNYRWQLNALNSPQAQKSVEDDEGYGEVNSFPRFGNPMQKRVEYDAINRIISRLRPTYAKRPRGLSGKRSIDLGLNRGFSGVQAAKHLLGLQAASFHGGPGRKKRTDPAATGATGMGWDQLGQT